MSNDTEKKRGIPPLRRAMIEVAFIIFLFYSNLLMGEFTVSNARGKTLFMALGNIFTTTNFAIALLAAITGYFMVEYVRKRV